MPLFRPEVLQAQHAQWLGSIRIARPMSFTWVTGVAIVLAVALVNYATWGEVTRKARLPGLLVPTAGLLNIAAPQAGQIAEILVREGEVVRAGQPLMRLRSERTTGAGEASALYAQALAQRRASLDTQRLLSQQQTRQRQDALTDRLDSLLTEQRQVTDELDASRLRAQLAARNQERFAELARSGFVSAVQAQQKQEEQLDVQLRERNAERSMQALQRDIDAARAELTANTTALQSSQAQFERDAALLNQESTENEARAGLTITARLTAQVSALTLHAGQSVQVGQTLLSLVPIERGHDNGQILEAHLFALSRTAGFVLPGQTVWLRYAAYPYQKFGMAEGIVIAVSQTPIAAQDLPVGQAQALLGAAQANEPLYRVAVRLSNQAVSIDGHNRILRAGMALEADVVQERKQVWEWLLNPLLPHISATNRDSAVFSANLKS